MESYFPCLREDFPCIRKLPERFWKLPESFGKRPEAFRTVPEGLAGRIAKNGGPSETRTLDPRIKSLSGPIRHNPPQHVNPLILRSLCLSLGYLKVVEDCPGLAGTVPKVYRI